jgi:hypothetical protein
LVLAGRFNCLADGRFEFVINGLLEGTLGRVNAIPAGPLTTGYALMRPLVLVLHCKQLTPSNLPCTTTLPMLERLN